MLLEANAPEHIVRAYLEHAHGRKALLFTPYGEARACDGGDVPRRRDSRRSVGWHDPDR